MSYLTKKAKNLSIRVIGNKANLVGITLLAASFFGSFGEEGSFGEILSSSIGPFGGGLIGLTFFGSETVEHYNRAMAHIKKYGSLDDRYQKTVLDHSRTWSRYCPEQGLYLAARDNGQLEDFKRLEKEYSGNKIPHF